MTPAARVAAAIEVLDQVLSGQPAEQALTSWARSSRFAGSKDRAAVRDHVYDVLRCKASLTVAAGAASGRALMIALCKKQALDLEQLFSGDGYGPAALSEAEQAANADPVHVWDAVDVPEWLWPHWSDSLGAAAEAAGKALQSRADVFLRVNRRLGTVPQAIDALHEAGIATEPHPTVPTCLRVLTNPRRVKTSPAYLDGLIEIQDAASQAAMLRLQLKMGGSVLDYCAGGGGKALAIADLQECSVVAHDIAFDRMQDIAPRAARARVAIQTVATDALSGAGQFDLVLCDAPCSGSGTWRRTPDAKWRLNAKMLNHYNKLQSEVLAKSAQLTAPGGQVAYMTCSVLNCENDGIVDLFLASNPDWHSCDQMVLVPHADYDGFYLNILQRAP